ncbi:SLC13 family permease [Rhodococcus sp. HM1]|uniref:SLC13 family permease n=1 Tax=Rhodococcus sp. HM1 TaxID=2937759 RepID=UPI00200AEDDF|nr:SLC13 family permease [Rhodococcus sp. HM1]MCK8673197.1 SLC13 family permease [Rhodococcus sp. HM1]
MTFLQIASVVILLGSFIVASVWTINMGLLLLVGGTAIAYFSGISLDVVAESFPSETFILIVGITYFFAVVESSKTMDFIVDGLLRLLRGSIALVPPLLFVLSAAATAIGAYPPAVAALVIPVAMRLARDYNISRFLVTIMVVHGILAGNFGPLATPAVFTAKQLTEAGLEPITLQLFVSHVAINGLVAVIAYFLFGGAKLVRAGRMSVAQPALATVGGGPVSGSAGGSADTPDIDDPSSAAGRGTGHGRPNAYQIATLIALTTLLVASLGFGMDIGFSALALGLLLTLLFERKQNTFINAMPWGVMLMLAGVLIYIGILTEIGTIDAINDSLSSIGSASGAVLALSWLSGIISAFASSITVIGATLQLALPLVSGDMSTLSVVGPVTVSTTIVDASPLGIIGALALATAEPEARPKLLRSMLLWAGTMVLLGPPLAWLLLTVL